MWRKIVAQLRRWAYSMGIIKGVQDIYKQSDTAIDEQYYDHIDKWKRLYEGYLKEWHDVAYYTVSGKQSRKMDTLQMPKIVSAEMASLVFNEKCEINISDDNLNDEIDAVFKQNKFYKKFQDYLEYNFALGGVVIKPYVEDGRIKLSYVTADCFIPLQWDNDTIMAGVFPNEFKKQQKKYTHLEWHVWENGVYLIRNEVYESEGSELGVKVPLQEFFPDLEEEVRINDLKKPLFTYFKPNTANNIDTQNPLGISIFANAMDTMKAIDVAFDSLHREFRLGKRKIMVPSSMLKPVLDPQTNEMRTYYDPDDEVYEGMNGDMDEQKVHDMMVELRIEDHVKGINALLNLFAMQTGFSAGTFSFDGESVKTATEVVSEQSKTFKTKKAHETVIEAGLHEVIDSIVVVAELYGLFSAPDKYEVSVAFDDSIAEDKTAEVTRSIQLVSNKLSSRLREIMKIHGMTEEEAQELILQINEENKSPEEEALFGGGE